MFENCLAGCYLLLLDAIALAAVPMCCYPLLFVAIIVVAIRRYSLLFVVSTCCSACYSLLLVTLRCYSSLFVTNVWPTSDQIWKCWDVDLDTYTN